MAKPAASKIYYDSAADRPRVDLRSGSKKLLTEDDAGGVGTITSITSTDTSVTITNPSGPVVDLSVPAGTTLTSTAPVDVTKAAAAVGTGTSAARHDHKHNVSTAAAGAATPGDAAAEGTATSLARSDHKHGLPAFGTTAGTFAEGNDSRFDNLSTLNEYWCRDSTISYGSKTDEFIAGSLSGSWSIVEWSTWAAKTLAAGGVDSTTLPAANNYRVSPNARRSWLMIQPNASLDTAMKQSFTYNGTTGFQFRTRFTAPIIGDVNSGSATTTGVSRFHITKQSSSNPDVNNYVAGGFNNGNPNTITLVNLVGGGHAGISPQTYTLDNTTDGEFIFIGSGNAGTITVDVYWRGALTPRLIFSGSINANNGDTLWLVWRMVCTSADTRRPNIYAMDYFREYPDLKITP